MKAHNLHVLGYLNLNYTPTDPNHAVRLQDLVVSESGDRPVFITDVVPVSSGNVGSKQYADTVPANAVLLSCISDTPQVRVYFLAEGGANYSPTIQYEDINVNHIEEVGNDKRLFQGYVDLVIDAQTTNITLTSSTGASTVVGIALQADGPALLGLYIDSIPAGQTTVKSGDTVVISGDVENTATSVNIIAGGAALFSNNVSVGVADSGGAGMKHFTGTFTVSNVAGVQTISGRAFNQLNTAGNTFASTDSVTLDQTYPIINATVTNDAVFNALGLGHTATIAITLANQDSQTIDFAHGTITGDPNAYLTTRTIEVTQALYSTSGGLTLTASRSSNGASTTLVKDVFISSILPNVSVFIKKGAASITPEVETTVGDIPEYPRFGTATFNISSDAEINASTVLTNNTNTQVITLNCGLEEYGFFIYPKACGTATFTDDANGFVGGWDGASWNIGDIGVTSGPIEITRNGEQYYLYRTDFGGINTSFTVEFTNPGLAVGNSSTVYPLTSSVTGVTYTVHISADQILTTTPVLNTDKGVWQGNWTLTGNSWKRDILISDADYGLGVLSDLVFTTESGEISSGNITYFFVKGFAQREVVFAAFSQIAPIGINITDPANVIVMYVGSVVPLNYRTDKNDVQTSFTITDSMGNVDANGDYLWLNDFGYASSNTSGTLAVKIEETI